MPPQMSTTLRPSTCSEKPAPISSCSSKLRTKASRTASKPGSTRPSTCARIEPFYGQGRAGFKFCDDAAMPAPPVDAALLDEAVGLARDAGRLTLDWFRSVDLAVDRK